MDMANEPMIITEVDQKKFNNSNTCYICNESFKEQEDGLIISSLKGEKVKDHCHYTGQFRGTANNGCILHLKKITDIHVFFHNLGGYNGHIIFQNLTKLDFVKEPKVVAKTMVRFITFSTGKLKFKDSLQFIHSEMGTSSRGTLPNVN